MRITEKTLKKLLGVLSSAVLSISLLGCTPYVSNSDIGSKQLPGTVTAESLTTVIPLETPVSAENSISLTDIPSYNSSPYIEINGNRPFFTTEELASATKSYKIFSQLDALGRCGTAIASVGQDLMPTEPRGSIGMIKPSGWHTVRYDDLIEDHYLFNRCHILAFELTSENVNELNLITGTRYMNTKGMLPFENQVADYVKKTGNHVLYRVTPEFEGNNLVASGVLMEAESVEDDGEGITFCVYCYNVQPGIVIDYATGDSQRADEDTVTASPESTVSADSSDVIYIGNTSSHKFHYSWCDGAQKMSESHCIAFENREAAIEAGYTPCKFCNP